MRDADPSLRLDDTGTHADPRLPVSADGADGADAHGDRETAPAAIEAALRGWLAAAVEAHYRSMVLAAVAVLGSWEDAEEAAQAAVLRASRFVLGLTRCSAAERSAQLADSPQAWLRCVARNTALDHLRARRRRPETTGGLDEYLAVPDPAEGPAAVAARRDLLQRATAELPTLFSRLPQQQARTMQAIWERGGWPPDYDALCAELNVGRGAARKRVHDALRNLSELCRARGLDVEVSR